MSNLQNTARRLAWMRRIPGFLAWNRLFFMRDYPSQAREVFGLSFRHPLGLAPVLDRQADLMDACYSLGYAFTGIIPGDMPVSDITDRLSQRKSPILAFVELRADGPTEEQARKDLIRTYSLLYDFTDCFVVDINRPSGLDTLDNISEWTEILDELLELRLCYDRYTPILLRLPPDQSDDETIRVMDFCLLSGIDGVIATGLEKVKLTAGYSKGRLPIIGSGAIATPSDAVDLLQAGACLLELSQGLPGHNRTTVRRILQVLDNPQNHS